MNGRQVVRGRRARLLLSPDLQPRRIASLSRVLGDSPAIGHDHQRGVDQFQSGGTIVFHKEAVYLVAATPGVRSGVLGSVPMSVCRAGVSSCM
jgi:hypothetical protein